MCGNRQVLARSYIWWPNLDQLIENVIANCMSCQQNENMPKKCPHPPLGDGAISLELNTP